MSTAPVIPEEIDSQATLAAAPAHCLRCSTDLSHLPEGARYCPRCGLDTHQGPPAALLAHALDDSMDEGLGWEHLRQMVAPAEARLPDLHNACRRASLMLTGYSNAMYRLGHRYETGVGAARVLGEALRCYSKAARLGNFRAIARLAARHFAHDEASADSGPQ